MRWRVRRWLLGPVVLVAFLDSGCLSLWAVGPPPSPPIDPNEPLECTRVPVAPVIDTGVATLLAYGAVAALAGSSGGSKPYAATVAIVAGIPALVSGVSALVGYRSTARCRELGDAADRCLSGDRGACGTLGTPGGPVPAPEPARPPKPQPPPPEPPQRIEPQPPPPGFFAPASDPA